MGCRLFTFAQPDGAAIRRGQRSSRRASPRRSGFLARPARPHSARRSIWMSRSGIENPTCSRNLAFGTYQRLVSLRSARIGTADVYADIVPLRYRTIEARRPQCSLRLQRRKTRRAEFDLAWARGSRSPQLSWSSGHAAVAVSCRDGRYTTSPRTTGCSWKKMYVIEPSTRSWTTCGLHEFAVRADEVAEAPDLQFLRTRFLNLRHGQHSGVARFPRTARSPVRPAFPTSAPSSRRPRRIDS